MRIIGSIPKATNTHSEYVILIAFPLQQWLHKHAALLGYTIPIIVQRDATQNGLFIIFQVYSTCFWCQPHPTSGVHKTVTTASGTGDIILQVDCTQFFRCTNPVGVHAN